MRTFVKFFSPQKLEAAWGDNLIEVDQRQSSGCHRRCGCFEWRRHFLCWSKIDVYGAVFVFCLRKYNWYEVKLRNELIYNYVTTVLNEVTNTVSSDVSSKFSTEGTLISESIRSTPLQEQRRENATSLMLILIKSVLQWRDNKNLGKLNIHQTLNCVRMPILLETTQNFRHNLSFHPAAYYFLWQLSNNRNDFFF